MPQTIVHFQIRMPPALHEKLASLAEEVGDSLNTVVVRFLTEAAEAEAKRKPVVIPRPVKG
jgi:predicted HicB family RNase H-like nuclease